MHLRALSLAPWLGELRVQGQPLQHRAQGKGGQVLYAHREILGSTVRASPKGGKLSRAAFLGRGPAFLD